MSNKLTIAIFIISFWLVLPIPMQLMNIGNYDTLDTDINADGDLTVLEYLNTAFKIVVTYFQLLILGIPNAPILVNIFLLILKLVSGLIIYLLVRGN